MTKQELLGALVEKVAAMDEDALLEVLYFADKVAQAVTLGDEGAQAAASQDDFARGDTLTLEEVKRGGGKE